MEPIKYLSCILPGNETSSQALDMQLASLHTCGQGYTCYSASISTATSLRRKNQRVNGPSYRIEKTLPFVLISAF